MAKKGKHFVSKRVVTYELLAFLLIILIIWLDEILDIPHLLFGAPLTHINWRESLFESAAICLLGALIVTSTMKLFRQMKYLEGILPVCASCKNIRDDQGNWKQIEVFVRDRAAVEFSHGICPECAKKLYPDFTP